MIDLYAPRTDAAAAPWETPIRSDCNRPPSFWPSCLGFWCACCLVLLGPGLVRADVLELMPVADTFINSGDPGNNAGGHTHFAVGRDGVGGIRRGLLQFDLSAIPAGATVTSAVLRLTIVSVPGGVPVNSNFDLFRLLAEWGEGNKTGNSGLPATAGEATWTARLQGVANWTVAGAKSDATALASASAPGNATINAVVTWSGAGLVADLQHWLDQPAQNFGWLLGSQAEGTARSVRGFASLESGTPGRLQVGYSGGSVPNVRPEVSITNPTDGAVLSAPANITIEAEASDSDGTVAQVAFFDGATSLGVDMTEPFSVAASLATGSHALRAVATDGQGLSATSIVVNVTVGGLPIDDPIGPRIAKGDITIELKTIADGMISPLGMAVPDDGSGRMFVYDQAGLVWLVTGEGRSPIPVLDVRPRLVNINSSYDERGLLGLAAHPDFAQNPILFTYTSEFPTGVADYTFPTSAQAATNHQTVIAAWRMDAVSTNQVDVASRRELLRVDKPQFNHNGGTMRFGPDHFLYVSLGDGGEADDQGQGHSPGGNAQNTTNIYGSVIRLDVDGSNSANGQYGVPADNPLVGGAGVAELYAWGLRNPFNFSFDRQTGQLYLGDVGQNDIEEVDLIVKGGNYGWNIKEGSFYFDPNGDQPGFVTATPVREVPPNLIDPLAEYDHDDGLAVIGGYVYRGNQLPTLAGRYVFGDLGRFGSPSGRLFYLDGATIKELRIGLDDRPLRRYLKGFGEDAAGELYVFASEPLGPAGVGGIMFQVVPPPDAPVTVTGIENIDAHRVRAATLGGVGPIVQQRKALLAEPVWMNEAFFAGGAPAVPKHASTGFFRQLDAAQQPAVPFSAWLTGENERPDPVTTAGTGLGIFGLEGNSLTFSISYQGLSAVATAAHIHGPANATNSAGVLIGLEPYHNGALGTTGSFSGTIVLSAVQKAQLMSGLLYANIHTMNHSAGEIRGQIAPVLMEASVRGAYELGGIDSPGNGFGSFLLVGNQLSFIVAYRQLSGQATMAHFHGPAPLGENAGVIIDLEPFAVGGFGTNGLVTGSVTLSSEQLATVIDGHSYVNFHTPAHQSGEIRGQMLARSTAVPLTAWLSGMNERPTPLTNSASGLGLFSLEGHWLAFNVSYAGLSGPVNMAHIHGPATTEEPGDVLINLGPFVFNGPGNNGVISGAVPVTSEQRDLILGGLTYINVHTTANPTGEARGQLASVLMTAAASGPAERPDPVATPGSALGLFLLHGSQLDFNLVYNQLSGAASGAHIHARASEAETAGVVIDLSDFTAGPFGAAGFVRGSTNLSPALLSDVIDGASYVNFHTTQNQEGEIRGQIRR